MDWFKKIDIIDLKANPKLYPIRIKAGALGVNSPASELTVSPQHRMLVRSKIAMRMFDTEEILIPALKLLSLDGVDQVEDAAEVEYFHLLFDYHEIIFTNGCPSESLFTGKQALKSLSIAAQLEIATLFPEICQTRYTPEPVRRLVQKNAHIDPFLARHAKNNKPLL